MKTLQVRESEISQPVIVTDDDLSELEERFALAMVPDSEYYSWPELLAEAKRRNEIQALEFEASCKAP